MNPVEGQRRFKTAGARLPNSRKLPREFFVKRRPFGDENLPPSSLFQRLASLQKETRRPSFEFTFMMCSSNGNKRTASRQRLRPKEDSPVKLPQLKKNESDQQLGKGTTGSRHSWFPADILKPSERAVGEVANRTLTKVSLCSLGRQ